MDEYRVPYLILFNHVTDAITLLKRGEAEAARALLVSAQQEAEEAFIEEL